MKKEGFKIGLISFAYVAFLLMIKLFNYSTPIYNLVDGYDGINLIPFSTIIDYIVHFGEFNMSILIKGILSLFILIPLTMGIYFIIRDGSKDGFGFVLTYSFGISISYSLLSRLLSLGFFDIDTVIFRAIIGAIAFYVIKIVAEKTTYPEQV